MADGVPVNNTLTGPNTNVRFNVSLGMPQTAVGVMQPGQYTVTGGSGGYAQGGTLSPSDWNINLTVTYCRADFNTVAGVTIQDVFDFVNAWLSNEPAADFNSVNGITTQDLFDFLTAWFSGC